MWSTAEHGRLQRDVRPVTPRKASSISRPNLNLGVARQCSDVPLTLHFLHEDSCFPVLSICYKYNCNQDIWAQQTRTTTNYNFFDVDTLLCSKPQTWVPLCIQDTSLQVCDSHRVR